MTIVNAKQFIEDQNVVIIDLKARLNRAIGLIAHLEFAGMDINGIDKCPECYEEEVHTPDCEVRLLLSRERTSHHLSKPQGAGKARYWESKWVEARDEIQWLKYDLARAER